MGQNGDSLPEYFGRPAGAGSGGDPAGDRVPGFDFQRQAAPGRDSVDRGGPAGSDRCLRRKPRSAGGTGALDQHPRPFRHRGAGADVYLQHPERQGGRVGQGAGGDVSGGRGDADAVEERFLREFFGRRRKSRLRDCRRLFRQRQILENRKNRGRGRRERV
ncbi:hypothetical protein SDC9_169617 [bioreactor metagenome]|uniref:Uncharacterized protein n=1 Tax=bioreactor metagenome TaxID=1076179 RepID=A0A645GE01_9ZZZZ